MSLKEYTKKRDFRKTPEPSGKGKRSTGDRFVVQKHDATNLHYDLRLELDGVLLSWAVPKGPSLDPSDKRLAIHVEDHPTEYGDFEGTIPQGEYGGGTVMLWDDGTWRTEDDPKKALAKGKLSFTLDGEKLNGGWTLTKIEWGKRGGDGKDNWLLIKHDDEHADKGESIIEAAPDSVKTGRTLEEIAEGDGGKIKSRKKTPRKKTKKKPARKAGTKQAAPSPPGEAPKTNMPAEVKPQLCTLTDEAPKGDDWLHEIKFDGYRLVARKDGQEVKLLTRNGKDWTSKFRPVADAIAELDAERCIIDGEACIVDDEGHSSFQQLQQAIKAKAFDRLVFFAFDLMYLDGRNLMRRPLIERKELLDELLKGHEDPIMQYSDHTLGQGEQMYDNACNLELEGIISKRINAPYAQRRSDTWLKVKCIRRQEFVIIGYSQPTGSRTNFGSLLLAAHDDDGRLTYAGRVGTGFSSADLKDIGAKLEALERKTCPADVPPQRSEQRGVSWVSPKLVCEVEFTEWTGDGRLRHPSFQGLRSDKSPEEIIFENPEPMEVARERAKQAEHAGNGHAKIPQKNGQGVDRVTRASRSKKKNDEAIVGGVRISSPERLVFPDAGITKLRLAEYYMSVAERILPFIANRPLATVRCPRGRQQKCFFQKHMGTTFSDPVKSIRVEEKSGSEEYIGVDSQQGLITLVQLGVIEIHPWGSKDGSLESPDQLTFDLDPGDDVAWDRLAPAAREVRDMLDAVGLKSFVKLTGGKGLHVVVPLAPRKGDPGWDDTKAFCKGIAQAMVHQSPEDFVATAAKAKRGGKIFIDYLRNGRGATSVAPYTVRARSGGPVAAPVRWDELSRMQSGAAYTVDTLMRRLTRLKKEPWEGYNAVRQRLTRAKVDAVARA